MAGADEALTRGPTGRSVDRRRTRLKLDHRFLAVRGYRRFEVAPDLKENVNGFLRISVAASAVALSVGGAAAQTRGDWVLARYKGGQYWYPSIVQTISGERLTIAYDDGDRETLNLSNVRPYDWAIGRRVECNFKGAGKWYPGVIASLAGETIGINYDDGDRERTKTGRCRSR